VHVKAACFLRVIRGHDGCFMRPVTRVKAAAIGPTTNGLQLAALTEGLRHKPEGRRLTADG